MCHVRICHMNVSSIKNIMNLCLISKYNFTDAKKCKNLRPIRDSTDVSQISWEEYWHPKLNSYRCFKSTFSRDINKYFLIFIDDYSRYTHIYLIKSKGEVFFKFLSYKVDVENQLNDKIKVLMLDRGSEYYPYIIHKI